MTHYIIYGSIILSICIVFGLAFHFFIEKQTIKNNKKTKQFNSKIEQLFKNSDNPALGDKSKIKLTNGDVLTFIKSDENEFFLHCRSNIRLKENNKIILSNGLIKKSLKLIFKKDYLTGFRIRLTKDQVLYLCTSSLISIKINNKKIKINKKDRVKYPNFYLNSTSNEFLWKSVKIIDQSKYNCKMKDEKIKDKKIKDKKIKDKKNVLRM